jgi:hypothetical protein
MTFRFLSSIFFHVQTIAAVKTHVTLKQTLYSKSEKQVNNLKHIFDLMDIACCVSSIQNKN